jgi:predicted dehydrogenase
LSRTFSNGKLFAGKYAKKSQVYHSLELFLKCQDFDVVYIASPHTCHFEQAAACLKAGKHVLVEKPFMINASQAKQVVALARANNRFCMEAMWTRFFPLIQQLKTELLPKIGDVLTFSANIGIAGPTANKKHRLMDLQLGGGALLDVGVYPISLCHYVMQRQKPSKVFSTMTKDPVTKCDLQTNVLLEYTPENKPVANASLMSSIQVRPVVTAFIGGTLGTITIMEPFYKPTLIKLSIN